MNQGYYPLVQKTRLHLRNASLRLYENGWLLTRDQARDFVRRRLAWMPRNRLTLPDGKMLHAFA